MSDAFETHFLTALDKPALVALSNPQWLEAAKKILKELGYKVHTAATHQEFSTRFAQVRYQVVLLDEFFAAGKPEENLTLKSLQMMPVAQRRHATIILFGNSFKTFEPMQAFQQSVHVVINGAEVSMLKQLVEKAVAENDLFLYGYRDVQKRLSSL
jgi:PleD family two-component response regulator